MLPVELPGSYSTDSVNWQHYKSHVHFTYHSLSSFLPSFYQHIQALHGSLNIIDTERIGLIPALKELPAQFQISLLIIFHSEIYTVPCQKDRCFRWLVPKEIQDGWCSYMVLMFVFFMEIICWEISFRSQDSGRLLLCLNGRNIMF